MHGCVGDIEVSESSRVRHAATCRVTISGTIFVALPSEVSRFLGHARFALVVVSFAGLLTLCCVVAWHAMLLKWELEDFCFGCNFGSSAIQIVGTLLH